LTKVGRGLTRSRRSGFTSRWPIKSADRVWHYIFLPANASVFSRIGGGNATPAATNALCACPSNWLRITIDTIRHFIGEIMAI
jgi:hypothetical protein